MTSPLSSSAVCVAVGSPSVMSKSDSAVEPDRLIPKPGATFARLDEPTQESLEKMMEEMTKEIKPWSQKIRDFGETVKARRIVANDLLAAQAALTQYLVEHPDQEGIIDVSKILVTLPETSPLHTGENTAVTLETLTAYYNEEPRKLELPELPTSSAGVKSYLQTLQEFIGAAQEGLTKEEGVALATATERRTVLLEAMKALMTAYSQIMARMVSAR